MQKYGGRYGCVRNDFKQLITLGLRKTRRRANHDGEASPISVQIAGADPQMMAEAAQYNADQGAQIIDINMAAPLKDLQCNGRLCVITR